MKVKLTFLVPDFSSQARDSVLYFSGRKVGRTPSLTVGRFGVQYRGTSTDGRRLTQERREWPARASSALAEKAAQQLAHSDGAGLPTARGPAAAQRCRYCSVEGWPAHAVGERRCGLNASLNGRPTDSGASCCRGGTGSPSCGCGHERTQWCDQRGSRKVGCGRKEVE